RNRRGINSVTDQHRSQRAEVVATHTRCNGAKSDYVAAEQHLSAWAERNRRHQEVFQARLREGCLPCGLPAAVQIAKWVYHQTEQAKGQGWVACSPGCTADPYSPAPH